jgi:LuxR family transcriptional regulator, quorum-sensing system regulator CviR
MLRTLKLRPIFVDYQGYVPPVAQPLFTAASRGEDLVPVVSAITKRFGFDTFGFGVSMSLRPDCETLIHAFTTMPAEWLVIYDRCSYVEVDPRIQTLLAATLSIVWDQRSFRGKSVEVDEFLDTGLSYGLGSGVAVGFVDRKGHGATVTFNSEVGSLDPTRKAAILHNMGDILLFAHFFEEMFAATIIEQNIPPRSRGAPLSARERECLKLAANGQTGDDIAGKLGITARTVQYHFDSIRSKLGANSRQEAVAKAVQAGIVTTAI